MLTPVSPPEEERLLASRLRPGFTLIHGYASDERGQPLPGVRIRLQTAGVATVTDERGYYWLSAPTPSGRVGAGVAVPGADTLIAEKPGYKTVIHRNIVVGGEDAGGYILGMERGTGAVQFDDTHKLIRKARERAGAQRGARRSPRDGTAFQSLQLAWSIGDAISGGTGLEPGRHLPSGGGAAHHD